MSAEQEQSSTPDAARLERLEHQIAAAMAFAQLATTRSHRAAKILKDNTGEVDSPALQEEIGAIEELLQKLVKELA